MNLNEREVAKDKAQPIAKLLLNGLNDPRRLTRVGTLIVAILHQCQLGPCRTLRVISFAHWYGEISVLFHRILSYLIPL
jgi:hypothetical protein